MATPVDSSCKGTHPLQIFRQRRRFLEAFFVVLLLSVLMITSLFRNFDCSLNEVIAASPGKVEQSSSSASFWEAKQQQQHQQQQTEQHRNGRWVARVNTTTMKALRQHMIMSQQKSPDPLYWNRSATRFMLEFVQRQSPSMFPLVDTVAPTVNDTVLSLHTFFGQEEEDLEIYKRFYNEQIQQCHTFGTDGLFESGAYNGLEMSNTFFFEKHFGIPTILVEASSVNWRSLVKNVRKRRPLAKAHYAALCPMGEESVCLEENPSKPMHKTKKGDCGNSSIPCFDFDDSLHYSLISLDIEGNEWEFIKFRKLKADIIIVEVIQWLRQEKNIMTAVEFTSYLVNLGYYLYASTTPMVGMRNFVFLSQDLVHNCFADKILTV